MLILGLRDASFSFIVSSIHIYMHAHYKSSISSLSIYSFLFPLFYLILCFFEITNFMQILARISTCISLHFKEKILEFEMILGSRIMFKLVRYTYVIGFKRILNKYNNSIIELFNKFYHYKNIYM